jgi:hypothetical protein
MQVKIVPADPRRIQCQPFAGYVSFFKIWARWAAFDQHQRPVGCGVLHRARHRNKTLHDRRTEADHSNDGCCGWGQDLYDASGSRGRHEDREGLREWRHRGRPRASSPLRRRDVQRHTKKPRCEPGLLSFGALGRCATFAGSRRFSCDRDRVRKSKNRCFVCERRR